MKYTEANTGIILDNYYLVKAIPKTSAEAFKNVKVGQVIHIEMKLTYCRNNDSKHAYIGNPTVNGVSTTNLTIAKLQDKGLVLELLNKN